MLIDKGHQKLLTNTTTILLKETFELPKYSIFCRLRTTIESVCLPITNDTYVDV